jgi:hypothetical protein
MRQCGYSGRAAYLSGTIGFMALKAEDKTLTCHAECPAVLDENSVMNVKNLAQKQLGAFMLGIPEKR